jgi:hypothetical protein
MSRPSLKRQLLISALVGFATALAIALLYAAFFAIAADGDANLGLGMIFLFVTFCAGSFVSGYILRSLTEQTPRALKSFLAAPCTYYLLAVPLLASFVHDRGPTLFGHVVLLIPLGLSWLLTFWGFRVRETLRDPNEPPQCASCGYNLTGNLSGICPECGTPTADLPPGPT